MARTTRSLFLLTAALGLAAGPQAAPLTASAEVVSPVAQNVSSFYLGNFRVTALSDGTSHVPFDALLRGISPQTVRLIFAKLGEAPDHGTSINAFLIDTGKRRILIDAGAGSDLGNCCGGLPKALARAGYPAETIDVVLLTHLHSDHAGGLTIAGRPTFPNAQIYVSRAEFAFWTSDVEQARADPLHKPLFAQARAALAPYIAADQVRLFDGPAALFPGVAAIPAAGHTPGHSFYRVSSGGRSILIVGDLIHAAEVQLPHPAVTIAFDSDEPGARTMRERSLAASARDQEVVAAAHVAFPGIGHVVREGAGYAWMPLTITRRQPHGGAPFRPGEKNVDGQ